MGSERKLKIIIDQSGNAATDLKGLSGGLTALGGIAGGVATAGLAAAGAGVVARGAGRVTSIDAAMEAQAGQAELAAVLESTGGKAGMTADAVNALASQFQALTPFEDDAILAGQNMLLTFTNIGKDVFPMATEAMLNMAQKFGSMDQASVMLGKALNDPIAGVTALRRVGVQLTEAQEAQIQKFMEVGNIAAAQKVILGELETEFGGLAMAAGETLTGKLAILRNTFGDMQETIGTAFLPALTMVADQLAAGLKSDQAQAALAAITNFITTAVVPAIGQIMVFVGDATVLFLDWASTLNTTVEPAMVLIQDALDRISVATGLSTEKFSISKTLLWALKSTLDAVTVAIKLAAIGFQAAAAAVETVSEAVRFHQNMVKRLGDIYKSVMNSIKNAVASAKSAIQSLASSIQAAAASIPSWLIPGSPTPFEIGLRGIAGAAGTVAGQLPQAFAVNGGGGGLAAAGAGAAGGAPVQLVIQYSPVVSTASAIEIEQNLIPLLIDGLRKRGVKV